MTCPPDMEPAPCIKVKDFNGEPSDMRPHKRLPNNHTTGSRGLYSHAATLALTARSTTHWKVLCRPSLASHEVQGRQHKVASLLRYRLCAVTGFWPSI